MPNRILPYTSLSGVVQYWRSCLLVVVRTLFQESKETMDDSLIDLILESQGRRMDDQRTAVPFVPVNSVSKEVEPKEMRQKERDEELVALVRRTPEPVAVEQNRRLSQGSIDSLNDGFFEQLMSAQNSRLEDQRSPDPFLERSQTLPGEDFLNLLLQLQSMRMEDQRSPFPNPFV